MGTANTPHGSDVVPNFHRLTDGRCKSIWFSQSGCEQLLDLVADPRELQDLSGQASESEILAAWHQRLTTHLESRDEGLVHRGKLIADRPHPRVLSHAQPV